MYVGKMTFSVIIPTINEAASIASLVTFIRENSAGANCEIVVVDGGSDDNTVKLAEQAGALVLHSSKKGRAAQMNLGSKHTTGSILYFVHADVQIPSSFMDDIQLTIQKGYDAGCYRYVFDSNKEILKVNAYFTRFDGLLMMRGGDQTLFVRREVFNTLKGFNEYYSIMEDYDFIIRLRKNHSFKIIQKDVIVSARKYETNSWLRVQFANLFIFILFRLERSPESMRMMYNKLLNYR